ncbi:alpha/beta hydrolase [Levilactobacillus tangyuanensis]|uniref:Alpha/beta hydrolase n=1 Tax=Levilactobacillus tangyuanensis TaxID=2486021 RepID=A0ABW1TJB2_9LACO|nr:alpha/beta hydrolase [Levilactobacillus tangyuanensis]
MNRKQYWRVGLFAGSWLIGMGHRHRGSRPVALGERRSDCHYAARPTLLIPGWGGQAGTYRGFIRWSTHQRLAHPALVVHVDHFGRRHWRGEWDGQATNPLVQVLFDHAWTRTYEPQIRWLTGVLSDLSQLYGVTSFNAVAHSWGGSALIHSVFAAQSTGQLPQLHQLLLLGAPVDESPRDAPPDAAFRRLAALKTDLDHLRGGRVLNVYGTLGGRLTDGAVPVSQITPLRRVVAQSPLVYREHEVVGIGHSRLHSARQMWVLISQWLWLSTGD